MQRDLFSTLMPSEYADLTLGHTGQDEDTNCMWKDKTGEDQRRGGQKWVFASATLVEKNRSWVFPHILESCLTDVRKNKWVIFRRPCIVYTAFSFMHTHKMKSFQIGNNPILSPENLPKKKKILWGIALGYQIHPVVMIWDMLYGKERTLTIRILLLALQTEGCFFFLGK